MANYILCPRCDLNYILDTEDYCAVCKADLKIGPKLMFSAQDDDDISEKILCPNCRTRYIDIEEDLCEYCRNDALRKNDHEADVSFLPLMLVYRNQGLQRGGFVLPFALRYIFFLV